MMHIMPVPGIFKGGQRITNFFAVTMVNILEMTYKQYVLHCLFGIQVLFYGLNCFTSIISKSWAPKPCPTLCL